MGQDDGKVLPMLGLKERQCKMKFAHMVEEKGPNEYAIDQVKEDIESIGDPSDDFQDGPRTCDHRAPGTRH